MENGGFDNGVLSCEGLGGGVEMVWELVMVGVGVVLRSRDVGCTMDVREWKVEGREGNGERVMLK